MSSRDGTLNPPYYYLKHNTCIRTIPTTTAKMKHKSNALFYQNREPSISTGVNIEEGSDWASRLRTPCQLLINEGCTSVNNDTKLLEQLKRNSDTHVTQQGSEKLSFEITDLIKWTTTQPKMMSAVRGQLDSTYLVNSVKYGGKVQHCANWRPQFDFKFTHVYCSPCMQNCILYFKRHKRFVNCKNLVGPVHLLLFPVPASNSTLVIDLNSCFNLNP